MPSKGLMIMVVGWIRKVSAFKCFIIDIRQTFRANPLSISNLETIISSHFTIMCMGKEFLSFFGSDPILDRFSCTLANLFPSFF